jgi:hypothetical protein
VPISASDSLTLEQIADWWSRWQGATPGVVQEDSKELLAALVSAFWLGEITDTPGRLSVDGEKWPAMIRLDALRMVYDRQFWTNNSNSDREVAIKFISAIPVPERKTI